MQRNRRIQNVGKAGDPGPPSSKKCFTSNTVFKPLDWTPLLNLSRFEQKIKKNNKNVHNLDARWPPARVPYREYAADYEVSRPAVSARFGATALNLLHTEVGIIGACRKDRRTPCQLVEMRSRSVGVNERAF